MRNGDPIAYGDPHMHTVIPICKITHMGIQDLISRMCTTSLCIRGVTEKSPYAYSDAQIHVCIWELVSIWSLYAYRDRANPRMHTGIKINPRMHTGLHLDPRMHMGITWHAIPVCTWGLILIPICKRGFLRSPNAYGDWSWSPYAYGDRMSCNPRMHMGIKM